MNLFQTINNLKNVLKQIPNVNTVIEGDVYQLNNIQDVEYAASVITQRQHSVNNLDKTITYNFYIFVIDRLTSDSNNKIDCQNFAIEALNSLSDALEGFSGMVVTSYQINTFTESFSEITAGAYATISIESEIDDCNQIDVEFITKQQALQLMESKQDKLVSGVNLKTVNGNSLLGSGNIEIEGGETDTVNIADYLDGSIMPDKKVYFIAKDLTNSGGLVSRIRSQYSSCIVTESSIENVLNPTTNTFERKVVNVDHLLLIGDYEKDRGIVDFKRSSDNTGWVYYSEYMLGDRDILPVYCRFLLSEKIGYNNGLVFMYNLNSGDEVILSKADDVYKKSQVYTKSEADNKFLTEQQSLEDYYTKTEIDEKIGNINDILETI